MNETSIDQESNKSTPEPNLFRLLQHLAGTLLGVLIFTLILLLFWIRKSIFVFAMLLPGTWVVNIMGLSNNTLSLSDSAYDVLTYSIAYVVSCLPFAILGSLFVSKKIEIRVIGITMFVIYLIFSLFIGLLVYALAID